jgi:hypothetical protein
MPGHPSLKRLGQWLLLFLLPAPLSVGASCGFIQLVGPNRWGALNSWLFDAYYSAGLRGTAYSFSWSWTTVFLILFALPYALLVVVTRVLLRSPRPWRFRLLPAATSVAVWCATLLLAAAILLGLYSVILPALPTIPTLVRGYPTSTAAYVVAIAYSCAFYGLPYTLLGLALHTLIFERRSWRKGATALGSPVASQLQGR